MRIFASGSGYMEAIETLCESPCILALPLCGASLDRFFPADFANSADARAFVAPLLRSGLLALRELHAEEVTHNDIKPANLCVKHGAVFDAKTPPEVGRRRPHAMQNYRPYYPRLHSSYMCESRRVLRSS